MLSEVRNYFGLVREISSIGQFAYFETTQLQQLVVELKLAIKDSTVIVLAGAVGTGKTRLLQKIQDLLKQGKDILVASSLSVDGSQVTQATLILALYCDLSTDKDDPMPKQTELLGPSSTRPFLNISGVCRSLPDFMHIHASLAFFARAPGNSCSRVRWYHFMLTRGVGVVEVGCPRYDRLGHRAPLVDLNTRSVRSMAACFFLD